MYCCLHSASLCVPLYKGGSILPLGTGHSSTPHGKNVDKFDPFCACLVTPLCLTLCNPMDCSLPGSSVHGNSPGKNTGWSGLSFPSQGDLPNSGIKPGSPAWQEDSLPAEPQGKPCVPQLINLPSRSNFQFSGPVSSTSSTLRIESDRREEGVKAVESQIEPSHHWQPSEESGAELRFPLPSPPTPCVSHHWLLHILPHTLLSSCQISCLNLDGWIMTFPSCSAHWSVSLIFTYLLLES